MTLATVHTAAAVTLASERIIVPGMADDDLAVLNRLVAQLAARQGRNYMRACRYDGKHAVQQVGSIIPPQYYRLGLVLGWPAKAVDILARRCNLDTFVWADGDLGDLGFAELRDANFLGSEVSSGIVSSLIHGVSFLITTRGDESRGEAPALIHAKDASSATGEWNPRRRRLDNLLSIMAWDEHGRPVDFALYLDGRTITSRKVDGVWEQAEQSTHPWGVPADPLVYKPRAGRALGSSRISRPVMSLHDQALRTVVRMEGHADVYSFPEMWLLGADESMFRNADGSQKAAWQIMLGRIKAIPDDEGATTPRASVQQFAAASPQPHIDQLKWQAQMFAGETSISVTSLGVADTVNPSSADAIAEARSDLIAEAEGATDDWSPALRRTVTRALAIANGERSVPESWAGIEPKWRSPLHLSRAAQADAGAKQLAAVPWLAETEVGLELLGLDEQQRARAMADRRRNGGSAALVAVREAAAARRAAGVAAAAAVDAVDG